MFRFYFISIIAIMLTTSSYSFGRDDLITVTKQSEQVSLATGNSISVSSQCPEKNVLVSGGGECLGFLNTENKIVVTKSAPDNLNAAWNVKCTNMNPQAGDAQAIAWAICSEH